MRNFTKVHVTRKRYFILVQHKVEVWHHYAIIVFCLIIFVTAYSPTSPTTGSIPTPPEVCAIQRDLGLVLPIYALGLWQCHQLSLRSPTFLSRYHLLATMYCEQYQLQYQPVSGCHTAYQQFFCSVWILYSFLKLTGKQ